MKTYNSEEEMLADGAEMTHWGAVSISDYISLLARYGPSVPIFALFQMPISQLLDRF